MGDSCAFRFMSGVDVIVGTNDRRNFGGIALGEQFQLSGRKHAWLDNNSTLGTTKRNPYQSALPDHQPRQRCHHDC